MRSYATPGFWELYRALPAPIRRAATRRYRIWVANPSYPSLRFKKVGSYWSVRVTEGYRALGVMTGDTIVWFWVGTHADYDRLLGR